MERCKTHYGTYRRWTKGGQVTHQGVSGTNKCGKRGDKGPGFQYTGLTGLCSWPWTSLPWGFSWGMSNWRALGFGIQLLSRLKVWGHLLERPTWRVAVSHQQTSALIRWRRGAGWGTSAAHAHVSVECDYAGGIICSLSSLCWHVWPVLFIFCVHVCTCTSLPTQRGDMELQQLCNYQAKKESCAGVCSYLMKLPLRAPPGHLEALELPKVVYPSR